MFATLTSKGQVTLPKEIRDQFWLGACSLLDFKLLNRLELFDLFLKIFLELVGRIKQGISVHLFHAVCLVLQFLEHLKQLLVLLAFGLEVLDVLTDIVEGLVGVLEQLANDELVLK